MGTMWVSVDHEGCTTGVYCPAPWTHCSAPWSPPSPPSPPANLQVRTDLPLPLPLPIQVRTIQLPGRGLRKSESGLCRIAKISGPVADAIASLTGPDLPLVLWGHGVGALCAFETARHLEVRRGVMLGLQGWAGGEGWEAVGDILYC